MEDCEICNQYKEHCYWNHQDFKGQQFYEVMKGDFSYQMKIPNQFSDRFNGELSEIVQLKSPSGNIWSVGLTKTANEMTLQTGWKEFVKDHHIQEGDLLVFKYNGNSCFNISMFNENHCEKAASYVFINSDFETLEKREHSLELLNPKSCHEVMVLSSSDDIQQESPFSTAPKISRRNSKAPVNYQKAGPSCNMRVTRSAYSAAHPKNNLDQSCTKENIGQEFVDIHDLEMLARPNIHMPSRRLTVAEKNKALLLVNAVQSRNPCFISVMSPSNVGSARFITIPSNFAAKHLPSQKMQVTLRIPGQQKKWLVNYITRKFTSGFCGKWNTFAHDNNLEEGDVCLFELVKKHRDITMKVHISFSEESNSVH